MFDKNNLKVSRVIIETTNGHLYAISPNKTFGNARDFAKFLTSHDFMKNDFITTSDGSIVFTNQIVRVYDETL